MRLFERVLIVAGAAAVMALAAETWIDRYGQESAAATRACAAQDYTACRARLLVLTELLDGRADIVYRQAKVEAALGNRAAALGFLTTFSRMGLTFADPAAEPAFADLRGEAEFGEIVARLVGARKPVSHSRPIVELAESDLIPEDIAYDSATERFLISSVRHGKILAVRRDGQVETFLRPGQPDVWAILALRVDQRHKWVWATTAAMPEWRGYQASDKGRSALLKLSLESGALLNRYDLPRERDHALGDLALADSGLLFASDGFGAVYRLDPSRDVLEELVPRGTFRSPQTPALVPGGRTVFVPDYTRGISIVDIASRSSRLLVHPPELSLGGIDGLYLRGRTMLAVQNGTTPPRLIRMQLSTSLSRVDSWEILESLSPSLGAPTHGVIVGRDFYFIANSGWDHMDDKGELKPGASFTKPSIRVLPVDAPLAQQRR